MKFLDWELSLATENPDLQDDHLIWSQQDDTVIICQSVERIAKGSIVSANKVGAALMRQTKFPAGPTSL